MSKDIIKMGGYYVPDREYVNFLNSGSFYNLKDSKLNTYTLFKQDNPLACILQF